MCHSGSDAHVAARPWSTSIRSRQKPPGYLNPHFQAAQNCFKCSIYDFCMAKKKDLFFSCRQNPSSLYSLFCVKTRSWYPGFRNHRPLGTYTPLLTPPKAKNHPKSDSLIATLISPTYLNQSFHLLQVVTLLSCAPPSVCDSHFVSPYLTTTPPKNEF